MSRRPLPRAAIAALVASLLAPGDAATQPATTDDDLTIGLTVHALRGPGAVVYPQSAAITRTVAPGDPTTAEALALFTGAPGTLLPLPPFPGHTNGFQTGFASASMSGDGHGAVGASGFFGYASGADPGNLLAWMTMTQAIRNESRSQSFTLAPTLEIPESEVLFFSPGGFGPYDPTLPASLMTGFVVARISASVRRANSTVEHSTPFMYGLTANFGQLGLDAPRLNNVNAVAGTPHVDVVQDAANGLYGFRLAAFVGQPLLVDVFPGETVTWTYELQAYGQTLLGETAVRAMIGDPFDVNGLGSIRMRQVPTSAVPEPGPLLPLVTGLGAIAGLRWTRRARRAC